MTTLERTPPGHQSYQLSEMKGASTCHCTGRTEPTSAWSAVLSGALARNPEAPWPWPLLTSDRKQSLIMHGMELYGKKTHKIASYCFKNREREA